MSRFGRLTSAQELDGILALDAVCFHRPWTRADYERELADPARCFLYVARDPAGQIVAYCSFWRIFDEVHVNNFAVHPSRRRQGLGRALLAHVLAEATGARRAARDARGARVERSGNCPIRGRGIRGRRPPAALLHASHRRRADPLA